MSNVRQKEKLNIKQRENVIERRCIVTRNTADRNDLVRFVLEPSKNLVIPDLKEKLPGRGVWVSCDRSSLDEAVKKNLFARAFKSQCVVSDDLPQVVEDLLEARALNSLSLAKKAGEVITGFDKVFLAMSKTQLDVLIEAKDGAEGGQKKLEKKFAAVFENGKVIKLFTSAQMDVAFGSTNVIHAAITHGNMTKNVLAAADKLAKYCGF